MKIFNKVIQFISSYSQREKNISSSVDSCLKSSIVVTLRLGYIVASNLDPDRKDKFTA